MEEGIAQLLRRCDDGLGALYRLIDGVQDLGDAVLFMERGKEDRLSPSERYRLDGLSR